ncbi:MAG: hypothetical protein V1867_04535 [Candidatus Falkowbacteria bacterium]
MKKLFDFTVVALLAVCLLGISSVSAENTDAEMLIGYEQEAEVSAMGVCDSMRSTIFHFTGKSFKEMIVYAPVYNSALRFYVVKNESRENEYFVREYTDNDTSTVKKITGPDLWAMLMGLTTDINFFYYIFPDLGHPHDCSVSSMIQQKSPENINTK